MSRLRLVLLVLLCLFAIGFIALSLREPRNDRAWTSEYARTVTAQIAEDKSVALGSVRDFTYAPGEVVSESWTDEEIAAGSVKKAWFLFEPFPDLALAGHTFLSFELEDGRVLSISVEARREEGEEYSGFTGLFNEFELAHQWSTERDAVTRIMVLLGNDLRRYPLPLTKEEANALFLGFVRETEKLAREPEFYNTLTSNCTNSLARIANDVRPGSLPYGLAWNLTGLSEGYLMKHGYLPLVNGSKEETIVAHDLTLHREEILSAASLPPIAFSRLLDSLVGKE